MSEGWIRVSAGTAKDRHGNPLTIKLNGRWSLISRTRQEDSGPG